MLSVNVTLHHALASKYSSSSSSTFSANELWKNSNSHSLQTKEQVTLANL